MIDTTDMETGSLASDLFEDQNMVAVTHSTSFREEGEQELEEENRKITGRNE